LIRGVSAKEETKKNVKETKEKVAVADLKAVPNRSKLEITSSNYVAASKKRQSALITSITKRSQSANVDRRQVNYHKYSSPTASMQQWNVITYYPTNYPVPKGETRARYITEIYDKATNRFIPATS
jgi:hypothetical protein